LTWQICISRRSSPISVELMPMTESRFCGYCMAQIILAPPGQPETPKSIIDFFMNAHKIASSVMECQSDRSAVTLREFL
jgi:hypothetical protein